MYVYTTTTTCDEEKERADEVVVRVKVLMCAQSVKYFGLIFSKQNTHLCFDETRILSAGGVCKV